MDHRCGERRSVVLDVVLRCRDKPALFGQTQNVSRDGMFVCLTGDSLEEHAIFEIEFTMKGKSLPRCHCQKAWVAHSSDVGAGLMLSHDEPALVKGGSDSHLTALPT